MTDAGLDRVRAVKGCGDPRLAFHELDRNPHDYAAYHVGQCDACLSLLVAAIRAEAMAEAVETVRAYGREWDWSAVDAEREAVKEIIVRLRALSPEEGR